MLNDFITKNRGNICWFTVPSGLFHGTIYNSSFESKEDFLILENSFYITGNVRLNMGNTTILRNDIVSWGAGVPRTYEVFVKDD